MPGIYSRDQLSNQLITAIENAQRRRQEAVDRQAAYRTNIANSIGGLLKSFGRAAETRETEDDDEALLARLLDEREEASRNSVWMKPPTSLENTYIRKLLDELDDAVKEKKGKGTPASEYGNFAYLDSMNGGIYA